MHAGWTLISKFPSKCIGHSLNSNSLLEVVYWIDLNKEYYGNETFLIEALHLFIDWHQTKRFEPMFSTVIMAVCSLFNRMLLLTDLIPVHLLYCGQTVMIGCNHTSFEWTRAVRHIYEIIRHMQGLYWYAWVRRITS